VFRACDLCADPFSFRSKAIQYLGSSFGGFLCNQISLTLMSCASETADKGFLSSGSGNPTMESTYDLSTFSTIFIRLDMARVS